MLLLVPEDVGQCLKFLGAGHAAPKEGNDLGQQLHGNHNDERATRIYIVVGRLDKFLKEGNDLGQQLHGNQREGRGKPGPDRFQVDHAVFGSDEF